MATQLKGIETMGKEAIRLMRFLVHYCPNGEWHSVARTDEKAMRAVRTLEALELINVKRHGRGVNPQVRLYRKGD